MSGKYQIARDECQAARATNSCTDSIILRCQITPDAPCNPLSEKEDDSHLLQMISSLAEERSAGEGNLHRGEAEVRRDSREIRTVVGETNAQTQSQCQTRACQHHADDHTDEQRERFPDSRRFSSRDLLRLHDEQKTILSE